MSHLLQRQPWSSGLQWGTASQGIVIWSLFLPCQLMDLFSAVLSSTPLSHFATKMQSAGLPLDSWDFVFYNVLFCCNINGDCLSLAQKLQDGGISCTASTLIIKSYFIIISSSLFILISQQFIYLRTLDKKQKYAIFIKIVFFHGSICRLLNLNVKKYPQNTSIYINQFNLTLCPSKELVVAVISHKPVLIDEAHQQFFHCRQVPS